jgi:hypothetical protein
MEESLPRTSHPRQPSEMCRVSAVVIVQYNTRCISLLFPCCCCRCCCCGALAVCDTSGFQEQIRRNILRRTESFSSCSLASLLNRHHNALRSCRCSRMADPEASPATVAGAPQQRTPPADVKLGAEEFATPILVDRLTAISHSPPTLEALDAPQDYKHDAVGDTNTPSNQYNANRLERSGQNSERKGRAGSGSGSGSGSGEGRAGAEGAGAGGVERMAPASTWRFWDATGVDGASFLHDAAAVPDGGRRPFARLMSLNPSHRNVDLFSLPIIIGRCMLCLLLPHRRARAVVF